jgi:hypothetical protein
VPVAVVLIDGLLRVRHALFNGRLTSNIVAVVSEAYITTPCPMQTTLHPEHCNPIVDQTDVEILDVNQLAVGLHGAGSLASRPLGPL